MYTLYDQLTVVDLYSSLREPSGIYNVQVQCIQCLTNNVHVHYKYTYMYTVVMEH